MYLTAPDLIARFGAEELAQRADRSQPRLVDADLLAAAAAGGDLSAWSAEARAAAATALVVIGGAIAEACSAIDGYLAGRYSTPLGNAPRVVARLASDIARFYLYDDHATEAVQKRYDAAIAFFRDVSAGKVTLGPIDQGGPAAPAAGGSVTLVSAGRVFGRAERGL